MVPYLRVFALSKDPGRSWLRHTKYLLEDDYKRFDQKESRSKSKSVKYAPNGPTDDALLSLCLLALPSMRIIKSSSLTKVLRERYDLKLSETV